MGNKKITKDKRYTTKSGIEVVIYQVYNQSGYCVHGAARIIPDGDWTTQSWLADGRYSSDTPSSMDLIELIPRIQRTYFINMYPYICSILYNTRSEADRSADSSRIACVKINIDVERGHGLTNYNNY